jgi:hypothetical protein
VLHTAIKGAKGVVYYTEGKPTFLRQGRAGAATGFSKIPQQHRDGRSRTGHNRGGDTVELDDVGTSHQFPFILRHTL